MGKMIEYSNFDYQGFQITDYTSIDLTEIAEYLASLPNEWIMTVKLNEGAKIETVCKSLYGSTNYIDIILFIILEFKNKIVSNFIRCFIFA